MDNLSPRQADLLEQISASWARGQQPTTGELVSALGLARESSLTRLLEGLQDKGLVQVTGGVRGRQRRIELTGAGRAATGLGLPVLGSIPAGPLREAVQSSDEWFESAAELLRTQPGDYLLRVHGESMIGAGILPGDLVLLRPEVNWRSGEIVAAQVTDETNGTVEATLKFLEHRSGSKTVTLRAANPLYPDREVPANHVSVAGVYRGLVRTA